MAQMKAHVPYLLCLAIFSTPSLAETKQSPPPSTIQPGTTILTLNKMCQETANSRPYTACVAYLRGLFDGMQQAKIVEGLKNTFCPPATAETDQLRLIVEGWVRDNPKNLSVSVGWAAPLALSLAFPCPK
jgi:Ssp1 endopeptidase immunity protein Rap1a